MFLGAAGRPSYLDLVRDRVVIFDGAMGTSIQNYNLDEAGYGGIEGCNEYLVLHNPGSSRRSTRRFSRWESTSSKRTPSAAAS